MDKNNKHCVILVINVGALPQSEIDYHLRYLYMSEKDFSLATKDEEEISSPALKQKSFFSRLKDNIKYHFGLKRVETLQIADKSFWKKFLYVMPRIGYDETKPTVITREKTSLKLPRRTSQDVDEYASEYKNVKSLRHIIVPIPDFMRTQLGFNKKSKKAQLEEISKSERHVHKHSTNKYDYSQQDYDTGKRVNGFSSIPYSPTSNVTPENQFTSSRNYHKRAVLSRSPSRTNNISIVDSSQSGYKLRSQSPADSIETRSTNSRRRSDTPEILASFKPDPNMVIKETPMRKTRSSSRQKSPDKYERSDLRSADRSQRRRSEDSSRLSSTSSRLN